MDGSGQPNANLPSTGFGQPQCGQAAGPAALDVRERIGARALARGHGREDCEQALAEVPAVRDCARRAASIGGGARLERLPVRQPARIGHEFGEVREPAQALVGCRTATPGHGVDRREAQPRPHLVRRAVAAE